MVRLRETRYWLELIALAIVVGVCLFVFQGNIIYQAVAVVSGVGIVVIAALMDMPWFKKPSEDTKNPHRSDEGTRTESIFDDE